MKRPKYKTLYEQKERDYQREYDRRAKAEHRLAQIRKILAPVGLKIGQQIPEGKGPVSLDAHDYLCISEWMHSGQRWTTEDEEILGFQMLQWKGRPLIERQG